MKYLNEKDIELLPFVWKEIFKDFRKVCDLKLENDFSQPLKPYLRYKDKINRIIAMPAYLGGDIDTAGVKWIASFPDNYIKGLPRAHSTIVLNEGGTGKPLSILNTGIISTMRTASVTGMVIEKYLFLLPIKKRKKYGIIGFGPIGKMHLRMIYESFGETINKIYLFDIKGIDDSLISNLIRDKIVICDSWEEVFDNSDIFITCTVSKFRYINRAPKKGTLQLNISLRDYMPELVTHMDRIIVDDWEEICRENTDIEIMYKEKGLEEKDVTNLFDFLQIKKIKGIEKEVVMFNPMGMAIFDICIAKYFYDKSVDLGIGTDLV